MVKLITRAEPPIRSTMGSDGVTTIPLSGKNSVNINEAGTYILSGTLEDGQVIVDSASKETVFLILDGADITCTTGAAICIWNAGTINITKSYEGLEGVSITINGGDIAINASDDGINAADGSDASSVSGLPDQNMSGETSEHATCFALLLCCRVFL